MKAAVFRRGGEPLHIEDVPEPVPGPGRVLLRVARCGICGTDLHMTEGHEPMAQPGSVLGHEFAGEVIALGPGVERLKRGDRIAVMPVVGCGRCISCLNGDPIRCSRNETNFGGFAELALAGEHECIKLPDTLSLADGALVEPLAVALHGVAAAGITPASRVLVMGAGPVGLGAIFWARRSGARHIRAIEGAPARAKLALEMGADDCTAPKEEPVAASDFMIGAPYPPEAPDIVFECVGRPGLLAQAVKAARPGGMIISMGCCFVPDSFIPVLASAKELTLRFPIAWTLRDFEVTADVLDSGAVEARAMVTGTVPLAAMPPAFEGLRRNPSQCKLLIDPGG